MTEKMDVTKVGQIVEGLAAAKIALIAVDIALIAAMNMLKVTAFVGLFGAAAVSQYLQGIQPKVREAAQRCGELSEFAAHHRQAWIDAGRPG